MFRALICPSSGARDYDVDYHIGRIVLGLLYVGGKMQLGWGSVRVAGSNPDDGHINPLTPNDPYRGRTAPLTSKRCWILYIYSTNIGNEYFKYGVYSPFLSLQNEVCFIILTYLVPVLFTFYIQSVLKLKKIIPAPKG